jgi:acetylglutamate kinase
MKRYIEKAETLLEALPYIRKFRGKIFVIKYGGNAMVSDELKSSFAMDIVMMKYIGINPIIVHGGGPQIGDMLEKLNIKTRFIDGYRITDEKVLEVVEMVLAGKVNKEIVGLINSFGGRAVGISGKDAMLINAEKLEYDMELGFVGKVKAVNPDILIILSEGGFIPVVAPVGINEEDGSGYNINADIVAGEIAGALKAEKLIVLTDVEGIVIDGRLEEKINKDKLKDYIRRKKITGGMIPKVMSSIKALENGVKKAHIIDGRVEHAILLEIFTNKGIGTEIVL